MSIPILSVDTETKSFDWYLGNQAFLATASDADRDYHYDLSDPGACKDFEALCAEAALIVCHNFSFDCHMIRESAGFDLLDPLAFGAALHDTDLMARIAWPEGNYGDHGGFSLDALTTGFLGRDGKAGFEAIEEAAKTLGYKGIKSKEGAYYQVYRAYPSLMIKYAKCDTRDTYDLYLMLRDFLAKPENAGRAGIYELERAVMPILIQAEQRGVQVDPTYVEPLYAAYAQQRDTLKALLEKELGEEALGGKGSEAALIEAFQKQGVPLYQLTDHGKLATNQFALGEFEDDFPIMRDFLEHRHVEKFLNTYIEPMRNREVVHCNFRQIGTWTGRTSCVRPNMTNIPVRAGSEVRDVFVAREGYKLVVADFDNIEVRLLAYYLGAEGAPYRQLINDGLDPHGWMAAQLHGGAPDDYAKGTDRAHLRAQAKNKATFPILYGAGGKKLCKLNNLPTGPPLKEGDWMVQQGYAEVGSPSYAQGKALARKVKQAIPGYAKLMRRVRQKIEAHGYITTLMGRHQAVNKDKGYVGLAALIQGSAADCFKAAMVAVEEALPDGAHQILFVHDEIIVEAPEHLAEECATIVECAMENAYDLDPPLKVSSTICDRWGQAK